MGLLSANEKAAIAGAPVYRQVWVISVPRASGSATFDNVTIHDDALGPYCVKDSGKLDLSAYNVSMQDPGRMASGLFRFEVDNSDGKFNASVGGAGQHFYNTTGTYAAMPSECKMSHYVYAKVAGAWDQLAMLSYGGMILSVEYDDNNQTAVIEAKCHVAVALDGAWEQGDGDETASSVDILGRDKQ